MIYEQFKKDCKSIPQSTTTKVALSWIKCKWRRVNTVNGIIGIQETLTFNHIQRRKQDSFTSDLLPEDKSQHTAAHLM